MQSVQIGPVILMEILLNEKVRPWGGFVCVAAVVQFQEYRPFSELRATIGF